MKKINPPNAITNIEEMAKLFASKIPKSTNFNNTKTRKYFSTKSKEEGENTSTMKDTLLYNISSHSGSISTSTANKNESISSNNEIIRNNEAQVNENIYPAYSNHHKKKSSNIISLSVSKEISKYTESRSTPKTFYKIPAKFMEEDEDLKMDSEEEEINENIPTNFKHNRTVDNVKKKKGNKDSICAIKEKLNSTDIDFLNSNHTIIINFEALYIINNLYTTLIKEMEIKKNKQSDYDSLIIRYFEIITDMYSSIYELEFSLNDKFIISTLKQFFIQEIIVFALSFMRGLDKNGQIILFNAFKNCFFYLHQNLIILMFMCAVVFKKNIQISENLADKNYLDLCKSIVDDNKIWLNKNNYKKYLKTNNKSIFATIKNIIKQIKEQDKDNQGEMINLSIIINYMKNYSKYKIDVIKENIFKKMINEKIVIDNNKNLLQRKV
jgi:hypothetical protein